MLEMVLWGFFFLFILVLNLAMGAFGYLMEKDNYEPDADLQKINKNPKNLKWYNISADRTWQCHRTYYTAICCF